MKSSALLSVSTKPLPSADAFRSKTWFAAGLVGYGGPSPYWLAPFPHATASTSAPVASNNATLLSAASVCELEVSAPMACAKPPPEFAQVKYAPGAIEVSCGNSRTEASEPVLDFLRNF